LLGLWQRAQQAFPSVRCLALGRMEDGQLYLSWSFIESPHLIFTVDIEPDGRIDWFYRNVAEGHIFSTSDDPQAELPEEALQLLARFS
jgi:hypothetical protein